MKKQINKQLTKALDAVTNAKALNEFRVKPDLELKARLMTVEQILREILYHEIFFKGE